VKITAKLGYVCESAEFQEENGTRSCKSETNAFKWKHSVQNNGV